MNSYTFTELSNRKIFPKSGIFNSLDGDFYLINSATLYLFLHLVWNWGINFVERDESAANQSSSLFWAEQELSQRDKKSFSFTMIGLHSTVYNSILTMLLLANFWNLWEEYLSHPPILYDILTPYMIILPLSIYSWREKVKSLVNFWKELNWIQV